MSLKSLLLSLINIPNILCNKTAPVIIDDGVFIGANCMILKGVHIGERQLLVQDLLLLKMCFQMKYGLEILQEKFRNKKRRQAKCKA